MNDAIYRLVQQYKDKGHGEAFIAQWVEQYRAGDQDAIDLEYDRRVVNRYFVNIAQLYQDRLITLNLARQISNFYGLNVFFKIVVPMNHALYGPNKPTYENELRRIRSVFGDGQL